jgi:hypothetical protein
MLLAVAGLGCFLIAFCLVLFTVYRVRPETFRLKATLTKWVSIDMEMASPQRLSADRRHARVRLRHFTEDDEPPEDPDLKEPSWDPKRYLILL